MRRWGLLFLGFLGLTAFLATSCNQLGNPSEQAVQAALGTYNYGGPKPGIAFLIVGDAPMTDPDGVEVKVTGPSGWNDGEPLKVRLYHWVSGADWWWWVRPIDLVDGDYTLESDFPEGIYLKKTVHLTADTTSLLARPTPELLATTTSATIRWSAVPGAEAYSVMLKREADDQELARWHTGETSITFNQLDLAQGETYYAEVFAFNAPLTRDSFTPPPVFKVSYGRTPDFTVTSTGTLKVLPSGSDQAPIEFDLQRMQ